MLLSRLMSRSTPYSRRVLRALRKAQRPTFLYATTGGLIGSIIKVGISCGPRWRVREVTDHWPVIVWQVKLENVRLAAEAEQAVLAELQPFLTFPDKESFRPDWAYVNEMFTTEMPIVLAAIEKITGQQPECVCDKIEPYVPSAERLQREKHQERYIQLAVEELRRSIRDQTDRTTRKLERRQRRIDPNWPDRSQRLAAYARDIAPYLVSRSGRKATPDETADAI